MCTSTMAFFVFVVLLAPLSFAECTGVGRVNSLGMANLALRARIARQGGLVGNTCAFRHPEAFLGANETGWHSFGYFSFATD